MVNQSEKVFIDSIDCNFPYHDREACLRLIDEAAALSTNAMFFVIEQICRIPSSEKGRVTIDFLLDLLAQTKTMFHHPLKEMVLDTAFKMIYGQGLTVDEAILKMERAKQYKGQYAALSILYFSCDDNEDKLELVWENIITEWRKNAHNIFLPK